MYDLERVLFLGSSKTDFEFGCAVDYISGRWKHTGKNVGDESHVLISSFRLNELVYKFLVAKQGYYVAFSRKQGLCAEVNGKLVAGRRG